MTRYGSVRAAATFSVAMLCTSGLAETNAPPQSVGQTLMTGAVPQIVGTWSLSLDAGPYGIPGYALAGVATFHRDGTFVFTDAGDFGGLGTFDTDQTGVWRYTRDGIVARSLFLSLNPQTGNAIRWQRGTFRLKQGNGPNHVVGVANGEVLNCDSVVGIPAALTCPDPVANADAFVATPTLDVPIEFRRLETE